MKTVAILSRLPTGMRMPARAALLMLAPVTAVTAVMAALPSPSLAHVAAGPEASGTDRAGTHRSVSIAGLPIAPALVTGAPTSAGMLASGGFDPIWSSIDGGGSMFSTDGDYNLGGTIGQPDAGSMSDGNYTVDGGFWSAAVPAATAPPTSTPAVTPGAAVLVGHVFWEGRPPQPHPRQALPITLTLKMGATQVSYPNQTTDASGFFTVSVGALPNGTYQWWAKGPQSLARSGSVALAGAASTQVEMGTLRTGDANNDNLVDIADFNALKGSFGRQLGQPGYDPTADFTGDDLVDITDFTLLKGNFGQAGAPPLGPEDS